MMGNSVRAAFDMIHAGAGIKIRTKEFIWEKTERSNAPAKHRRGKMALAFAMMLAVCLLAGGWTYFTPVSAISIDINPSLELGVNRFNRVVSVTGCNEDGEILAQNLSVRFLYYRDALEQVLGAVQVSGEQEEISIVVSCDDEARSGEMLKTVQSCAEESSGSGGVYCHAGSMEEASEAHEVGMSCGRYRAYLELKELSPEVSEEDVQGMTMREIRDMINALSAGEADLTGSGDENDCGAHGAGSGGNGKHGQGHHYGGNGGKHHGRVEE